MYFSKELLIIILNVSSLLDKSSTQRKRFMKSYLFKSLKTQKSWAMISYTKNR